MSTETTEGSRPAAGAHRSRLLAGAGMLIAGSGIMCGTTLAGLALYQNVLVLGLIVVAAWLLDGTNQRYMGAGLAATAVGLGLVLGGDFGVPAAEHGVVYPLLGLALLLIARVSPREAQGAGGFLVIVGATVWTFQAGADYNAGYSLAVILAVWGIIRLAQVLRGGSAAGTAGTSDDRAAHDAELARS